MVWNLVRECLRVNKMRSESEIWEGRPTKPALACTFIFEGHLTLGTLPYPENIMGSSRIRGMAWLPAHGMSWVREQSHRGHLSHRHQ